MRTPFLNTPFLRACAAVALVSLATSAQTKAQDAKATIVAANQKFISAFAQGATTMGNLYASDAQLFPPNSEVVSGSTAIGSFWKTVNNAGIKNVKLETLEAEPTGSTIVETGRYTLYAADGKALDNGKYLVVWKKEGSDWKLFRDIWNTSQAAAK